MPQQHLSCLGLWTNSKELSTTLWCEKMAQLTEALHRLMDRDCDAQLKHCINSWTGTVMRN